MKSLNNTLKKLFLKLKRLKSVIDNFEVLSKVAGERGFLHCDQTVIVLYFPASKRPHHLGDISVQGMGYSDPPSSLLQFPSHEVSLASLQRADTSEWRPRPPTPLAGSPPTTS